MAVENRKGKNEFSSDRQQRQRNTKLTFWTDVLLLLAVFAAPQICYLILGRMGMLDQDFSKPIYNALFLIPCIGLVHYRNLSASDLGLKVVIERIGWHAAVCFFLFIIYMLFYLFVGRISSLRPISAKTWEEF